MAHQETLINWLNDAHGLETNLVQVLESHVQAAKNHPQVQSRLQQHLDETRRHAEMVKGCIERLGGNVSGVKTGISSVMGAVQGVSTAIAKDELVKNTLADYASEHFEIACYTSLIAGARAIGDEDTARVCETILRDEEQMAHWLHQQIPVITQEYLGEQARAHGV